jgi:hypothetical protein
MLTDCSKFSIFATLLIRMMSVCCVAQRHLFNWNTKFWWYTNHDNTQYFFLESWPNGTTELLYTRGWNYSTQIFSRLEELGIEFEIAQPNKLLLYTWVGTCVLDNSLIQKNFQLHQRPPQIPNSCHDDLTGK